MDDLEPLLEIEERDGARLRLQENTSRPEDGPLPLTGRDSRGRAVKIVGTEAFLCKMLLMFPSMEAAQA